MIQEVRLQFIWVSADGEITVTDPDVSPRGTAKWAVARANQYDIAQSGSRSPALQDHINVFQDFSLTVNGLRVHQNLTSNIYSRADLMSFPRSAEKHLCPHGVDCLNKRIRTRSCMRGKMKYYFLKLPCILILIIFGLLMEFLVELPFMVMCTLDRLATRRKIRKLLSDQPK